MFEYTATRSTIANWVYSQVDSRLGVLFPRGKGWEFFFRYIYLNESPHGFFIPIASNQEEAVIFIPVDDTPSVRDVKTLASHGNISALAKEVNIPVKKCQVILASSEKYLSFVSGVNHSLPRHLPLLVLRYDRVEFVSGEFSNPRLEYRLSVLSFDPDLIPGFLVTNQFLFGDRVQKLFYLQKVFQRLDLSWAQGRRQVPLREVAAAALPCWRQLKRGEQRQILADLEQDFEVVLGRYFDNGLAIQKKRKNERSPIEIQIELPGAPQNKKEINSWTRGQKHALEHLCHHIDPIVIDMMEISAK